MDKDRIFNGTLEKRFAHARKSMVEDYNSDTISRFHDIYKDADLPFILSHSRDIFSESYCGLDFYASVMESAILDTDVYRREWKKMELFIGEATNKGMPKNQLEMYHSMYKKINDLFQKYRELDEIFQSVYATEGGREYVECVVSELYDAAKLCKSSEQNGDTDEIRDAKLMLDTIALSVFTCKSIYAAFALGILIVQTYPQYTSQLIQLTDDCMVRTGYITDSAYKRQRVGLGIIKKLMKSQYIENFLMLCSNSRLSSLWYRIKREDINTLNPVPVTKSAAPELAYTPAADSHNIADLEDFIEDLKYDPTIVAEKYDLHKYMAAEVNADIEILGDYNRLDQSKKLIYESLDDLANHYEAGYMMLEWEDDGSPNPIIKKHIMTSKERAAEKEKENRNTATPINNLRRSTEEEIRKSDEENDLCEKINETISEVQKVSPSDDSAMISRNKDIISSAKKDFGKYKKIIDDNPEYSRAKALCNKLLEEIKDVDSVIEESVDEKFEGQYDTFIEEASKDSIKEELASAPIAVNKPKPDILTRVQNKALDKAAKNSERYAARKEKEQKLVNAGKALAEDPKRAGGEFKSFVKKWDSWDENRRKEFLLKPGFRHKIFKNFKIALTYGTVAHMKLAWIPLLGLIRHCSKMKDARIRNELSREFEAEIKICEAKISDAAAKGDNESKYELMRIKDKLEAERSRVRTNSKYV